MIDMIFVCGCPRSGNTLMGELIGTLGNVTYCGELGVSYFSTQVSKEAFRRTPSSYAEAYRANLMINALDFLTKSDLPIVQNLSFVTPLLGTLGYLQNFRH